MGGKKPGARIQVFGLQVLRLFHYTIAGLTITRHLGVYRAQSSLILPPQMHVCGNTHTHIKEHALQDTQKKKTTSRNDS